jgi:hypothetical protein
MYIRVTPLTFPSSKSAIDSEDSEKYNRGGAGGHSYLPQRPHQAAGGGMSLCCTRWQQLGDSKVAKSRDDLIHHRVSPQQHILWLQVTMQQNLTTECTAAALVTEPKPIAYVQ